MAQHETPYRWTGRDKLVYAIALVPFLVAFIGTIYLLGTISVVLNVILLGMYLMANVFQAGCCVGCPYRGKYCPALFGVYLGNWLSSRIYVGRQFNPRFFKTNATLGEISVIGILECVVRCHLAVARRCAPGALPRAAMPQMRLLRDLSGGQNRLPPICPRPPTELKQDELR